MSSTTLLQLVQQAAGEIGLNVPSGIVASTNTEVVQLYRLINAVGYEVQRDHDWQALQKAYLFTTAYTTTTGTVSSGSALITAIPSTAGLSTSYNAIGTGINTNVAIQSVDSPTQVTLTQTSSSSATSEAITFAKVRYALPSDWERQINETHWDKNKHWKMLGPETPQQWEWLTSGYIATGPRVRYRIFGGYFQIWPPQTSSAYLGFEYVSNAWAASTTGTAQSSFQADTDTCIFPDRLIVLGLKHKYTEAKGLPLIYQSAYKDQLDKAIAMDAGAPNLSFAPRAAGVLISWQNIPDSGFGS